MIDRKTAVAAGLTGLAILTSCQESKNISSPIQFPTPKVSESCPDASTMPNILYPEVDLIPTWTNWEDKTTKTFNTDFGYSFVFFRKGNLIQRFFGEIGTTLESNLAFEIQDNELLAIDMSATHVSTNKDILFGALLVQRCGDDMYVDEVLTPTVTEEK